jgi:hypothetical protein
MILQFNFNGSFESLIVIKSIEGPLKGLSGRGAHPGGGVTGAPRDIVRGYAPA